MASEKTVMQSKGRRHVRTTVFRKNSTKANVPCRMIDEDNRLIKTALWPMNVLLIATGVPCYTSQKRRRAVQIWSWFWLLFVLQSETFIVLRCKNALSDVFKGHATTFALMKALNNCLIILLSFVFDTVCHFCLVLTLPCTLQAVWNELKYIDNQLKYIDLQGARRVTIFGVLYLIVTVLLNFVFNIHNQITNHCWGSMCYIDFIQTMVRAFSNQWFHVIGVWIFASLCQSIRIYHHGTLRAIEVDFVLNSGTKKLSFVATDDVLGKLKWFRSISRAANLAQDLLSPLLLANICSSLLYIVMFTFYAIEDVNRLFPLLWDLSDITDAFVRYWVMAHAADGLRSISTRAIPLLRQIREACEKSVQRRKITLLIVELGTTKRCQGILMGVAPIGKKTILKTLQTIATYLIIICQFKITN